MTADLCFWSVGMKTVGVLAAGVTRPANPPQSLSCDHQLSGRISNPSEKNEGSQTVARRLSSHL